LNEENNDLQLQSELLLSRLTFSHFIELIRVEDELQRLFYEVETIKNKMNLTMLMPEDECLSQLLQGK
jgi:hypothetical protein